MTQETTFRDIQVTSSEIVVRKIGMKDLFQSLKEGYGDFVAKPSFGVFLTVFYPLFALLFTLFLIGENLLYLAFPVIAGLTLLGPVVSVALFEMSRRRELGLDLRWARAFDFVHSSSFVPILVLSIAMMVLYLAWLYMAQFIFLGLFGENTPTSVSEFISEVLTTRRGGALIVYGNAVGFLFAFTALAISVVAFPLLLDKPTSIVTAVSTSVTAVTSNMLIMAVWGVIVVTLLAAGTVLFLVGLAAILPILGHATWHLYRKVVEP
jgi:uncharacterized membrane protein